MSQIIEIACSDGTTIYLEAENSNSVPTARNPIDRSLTSTVDKVVQKSKDYMDDAFKQISSFASAFAEKMKQEPSGPDEIEVGLAVKFTADLGMVIARADSETGMTVKLKWNNSNAK